MAKEEEADQKMAASSSLMVTEGLRLLFRLTQGIAQDHLKGMGYGCNYSFGKLPKKLFIIYFTTCSLNFLSPGNCKASGSL